MFYAILDSTQSNEVNTGDQISTSKASLIAIFSVFMIIASVAFTGYVVYSKKKIKGKYNQNREHGSVDLIMSFNSRTTRMKTRQTIFSYLISNEPIKPLYL